MRNDLIIQARYKGKDLHIPEVWWAGFTQTHPKARPIDVVRWWAWQQYMAEHGEVPPRDY